jgi:hypothetical protein
MPSTTDHAAHVVDVARAITERCQGEAAVAADDRGDAVERRRARGAVPEHLRVVVGVEVDDAGGNDETVGVERSGRRFVDLAHGDDAAVPHAQIAGAGPRPGPVDDGPTGDQEIQHDAERTPELGLALRGAGSSIDQVFGVDRIQEGLAAVAEEDRSTWPGGARLARVIELQEAREGGWKLVRGPTGLTLGA